MISPDEPTTRYCALCGQCEVCMSRIEEECWDNDRGDHLWTGREPHMVAGLPTDPMRDEVESFVEGLYA